MDGEFLFVTGGLNHVFDTVSRALVSGIRNEFDVHVGATGGVGGTHNLDSAHPGKVNFFFEDSQE